MKPTDSTQCPQEPPNTGPYCATKYSPNPHIPMWLILTLPFYIYVSIIMSFLHNFKNVELNLFLFTSYDNLIKHKHCTMHFNFILKLRQGNDVCTWRLGGPFRMFHYCFRLHNLWYRYTACFSCSICFGLMGPSSGTLGLTITYFLFRYSPCTGQCLYIGSALYVWFHVMLCVAKCTEYLKY
jgi:hypothetical protein